MKKIYFCNNYSGENAQGLKDSVYPIRDRLGIAAEMIEETGPFNLAEFGSEQSAQSADLPGLRNLSQVTQICAKCRQFADSLLDAGDTPVLIAGDHSISMASVAATSAHFPELGVIWIDAHADINTEKTTPSGNIHGMPLASLLGLGSPQLTSISGGTIEHPLIKPENLVYLGLRDLDPGELKLLRDYPIKTYWYDEIKERGLDAVLQELKEIWQVKNIHVSLDFDSLDPELMPGVSVPVPEGFKPAEVAEILHFLEKNYDCRAFDFVEYNASCDIENQTLENAVFLIKKIL